MLQIANTSLNGNKWNMHRRVGTTTANLKARAREEYQLQEEQKELGMTWAQVLIVPTNETVHNSGSLFGKVFSKEIQRSTD